MSLYHALHIWGFTGLFVFFCLVGFFFSTFLFPKTILNYMKKYFKLRSQQFIKCWKHSAQINKKKPKNKTERHTPKNKLKTHQKNPNNNKTPQSHNSLKIPLNKYKRKACKKKRALFQKLALVQAAYGHIIF